MRHHVRCHYSVTECLHFSLSSPSWFQVLVNGTLGGSRQWLWGAKFQFKFPKQAQSLFVFGGKPKDKLSLSFSFIFFCLWKYFFRELVASWKIHPYVLCLWDACVSLPCWLALIMWHDLFSGQWGIWRVPYVSVPSTMMTSVILMDTDLLGLSAEGSPTRGCWGSSSMWCLQWGISAVQFIESPVCLQYGLLPFSVIFNFLKRFHF